MADIQKLTYPYFADGTTQLNAANLNPVIQKLNELIDVVNSSVTISNSDSGLLDVADANGNVIMRLNHSLEVTSDKQLKIGGVTK